MVSEAAILQKTYNFLGLLRFYDFIFGSVSVRFCTENRGFGFPSFGFYVKYV